MSVKSLFANARRHEQLSPGTVLFRENEVGAEMFGVVSGCVELSAGGVPVARVEAGGVFGEMALVDSSPRSLTATALIDTTVAVIDRHTFLFLIHETPTFALDVMSSMAERLRARTAIEGVPAAEPTTP